MATTMISPVRRRWLLRVFVLCLFLLPALVQAVPAKPNGARVPAAAEQSTQVSPSEPSLDEMIQLARKKFERVRGEFNALRAASKSNSPPQLGATPEESAERERLLRSLVRTLEQRLAGLQAMKEVRRSQQDLDSKISTWQGFAEPPPYSIDRVDNLHAAIAAKRKEIQATQYEQELVARYLSEYEAGLKAADQQLRAANEDLEQAPEGVETSRLRWIRDLVELRLRYFQAAVARFETQRQVVQEKLALMRQSLEFTRRQARVAAESSPLSEIERDKKLEAVAARRGAIQKEIAAAQQQDDAAQERLEKARERLRAAREALIDEDTDKAKAQRQARDLDRLEAELEVRKAQADTASQTVESLKLLLDALAVEQSVWQERHLTAHTSDPVRLEEAYARVQAALNKAELWKSYVTSNREAAHSLVTTEEQRLSDWKPEFGDIGLAKEKLTAYRQRQELADRLLRETHAVEQLLQRYVDELQRRRAAVPVQERVTSLFHKAVGVVVAVWGYELFAVEDTIVVDGQQIVGKRSVTVGKVVLVLLIVAAGLWLAGFLGRRLRGILITRLNMDPAAAVLLHRTLFVALILALLLFALASVRIPLTVLAFLGGALAIGIGFGAQNLINNFISGVILLLERPIKHGDIVDIEGVRGKVVNIGGRCSQVRRFDGVDLLIPNSSFLEKNVVNWTLSDRILRIAVRVGVAYDSPTREVARLLQLAVEEHGKILKDPEPVVLFEDFGSDALVFAIYFWVELSPDTDQRVIASDVRYRIDKLLAQAGISIAYPQRDIHLDSRGPIQVQVTSAESASPGRPETVAHGSVVGTGHG